MKTRTELVIVLLLVLVVGGLFISSTRRSPEQARSRVHCASNLKVIGLAFELFGEDNAGRYPMELPTRNNGGTVDWVGGHGTFRYFQALSNDLPSARVLICPSDTGRSVARNLAGLSNSNISYFVHLDAVRNGPVPLLAGDRTLKGPALENGILLLTPGKEFSWRRSLHGDIGMLLFSHDPADESRVGPFERETTVKTLRSYQLRYVFASRHMSSNRLAMPIVE